MSEILTQFIPLLMTLCHHTHLPKPKKNTKLLKMRIFYPKWQMHCCTDLYLYLKNQSVALPGLRNCEWVSPFLYPSHPLGTHPPSNFSRASAAAVCVTVTFNECGLVIRSVRTHGSGARKFNHKLVLRTVHMRTESETAIVLYTVHVRTVYNEKRSLIAVHAHGKQTYTVCTCARNVKTMHRAHARTAKAPNVFGAVHIY